MPVTIQTRKVLKNPLLHRKQMVVHVLHPGQKALSRIELRNKLAKNFKVKDPECVITYGLRTVFGGGKTTGFALIYDKREHMRKIEIRYRKIRHLVAKAPKKKTVRKARKERKNKDKKNRGVKNQKEQKAKRRQKNQ
ncbi:putative 40S ribosomal protein S24 [Monocercomonoides exilis]|nr:putative 40S ribosomal protein S24 [Monocercomonoides exilis]|eukprot:MONOS_10112.1-p1 / transcript=MONOS_10112.1 / gene=MONOS_10112 / organism=Monocercomonoides_exilis_PA203 / gene_product=40S ribosomal protein S24 / transcript_product=40S ribosomal protein S24 / location=Mono_scaffold00445:9248-9785(+) / protein_length=136 / sequence_SO=supercontig / SO=protein_coding / is_pseudo=false